MAEQKFSSSQGYMIGGPGLTIEVDESMFGNRFFAKFFIFLLLLGKRKYRRGRISGRRQMWVLGGACRYLFHYVANQSDDQDQNDKDIYCQK